MPKKIEEDKIEDKKEVKKKTTTKKTDAKEKVASDTPKSQEKQVKKQVEKKATSTTSSKIKKAKSTKGKKKTSSLNTDMDSESVIKIVEPEEEKQEEEKKEIVIREDELEEIEKTIKKERVLPKGIEQEAHKKIFTNLMIASSILLFFIFLILGEKNITESEYVVDIKVFAISFMFFAIVLFEKAYKKDSGTLAFYGIELLVLGFVTMFIVNIMKLNLSTFYFTVILNLISYVFALYYCIKSIVLYNKLKNKMNDKKHAEIRKTMKK